MNKKILLSTILASSLVGVCSSAFADINFGYDSKAPKGKFTVNTKKYDGLFQAVKDEKILDRLVAKEKFVMPAAEEEAFMGDFFADKNNLMSNFWKGLEELNDEDAKKVINTCMKIASASIPGVTDEDITEFTDTLIQAYENEIDVSSIKLENPKEMRTKKGLEKFTKSVDTAVDKEIKKRKDLPNDEENKKRQDLPTDEENRSYDFSKNPTFEKKYKELKGKGKDLAASYYLHTLQLMAKARKDKSQYATLSDKIRALEEAREEKGENVSAQITELKKQMGSTQEAITLRNHPNSQELLKNTIELIKHAQSSTEKDAKDLAKNELEYLKDNKDLIFADPSRVKVADLPEVQKPDTHGTAALLNSSNTTSHVLTERIGGFTPIGVASGDVFQTYGAWAKGSFSTGTQKAFKAESGYKFAQKGLTIGVDTGDESMIGVAYSFFQGIAHPPLHNDSKNKTSSSAKDKIDTHMGSVYGLYSINSEFFVSAQASYGHSKIKKTRATGDLANNLAKGKTKGTTMAGRAEVGYVYQINELTQLMPAVGIAHNNVFVKGYSETGLGLNRNIGKRTSTRTSGVAGVSVRHMVQTESVKVIPELHANVDFAFKNKNSATVISLVNGFDPLITPSEKLAKLYYNVGGSLKFAACDNYDVTAGYDLGLSKKFISHTGTMKLRVNF